MKIGYFTDIHFHKHKPFSGVDGRRRLEDTCNILRDIFNIFREEACNVIVFGGDWFHSRRSIDVDTLNTVRDCLLDIPLGGFPEMVAVAGNHDYYDDGCTVCSLDFLEDFGFKVIKKPKIDNYSKNATLYYLPWADINTQLKQVKKFRKETGKPKILFTHTTPYGSSSPMGYVFDEGIDSKQFKFFDKVFCGHIHKRQEIGNLYLPGPPLQLHFGERDNHCGVYTYDVESNHVEFHSLDGSAPRFHICDGVDIGDELKLSNIKGNHNKLDYFRVMVNSIPEGEFNDRVEFVIKGKEEEKINYEIMSVGLSKEEVVVKYAQASRGFDLPKLIDTGLDLIR